MKVDQKHIDVVASSYSVMHNSNLSSRDWGQVYDDVQKLGLIDRDEFKRLTTTPLGDELMEVLKEAANKFLEERGL